MIDVAHAIAAAAAIPGDYVSMPKHQYAEMLGEVELGQRARLLLATTVCPLSAPIAQSGTPA
jgi:hypothetical protein